MDHRIPKVGFAIGLICAAVALVTFVFLNAAFEGPSPTSLVTGEGYRLSATFDDTEVLPTKQPVLIRGLEVGKVKEVSFDKEDSTATVEFTVEDEYAPVYRDARVLIGERTVLGDPYLRLEPGHEEAGELEAGATVKAVDSVDFDEALDFLDEDGRARARSVLDELRDATRAEDGAEQLNVTVANLSLTLRELRQLTDALRGQERNLAGLVSDSAAVLDELGSREAALRQIVASGRVTLDALASRADSLEQGLAEAPGLLEAGRSVLVRSRPLLREAAPLVSELRRSAPHLVPILADLPSVASDTVDVVGGLSGIPTLRRLLEIVKLIGPSVADIEAAARNLVPLLAYTAKRAEGIGAFFANFGAATQSRDSAGHWLRTAFIGEAGLTDDTETPAVCRPEDDVPTNAGLCRNAYPPPGDGRDPEPYQPGSYPRLRPYDPP